MSHRDNLQHARVCRIDHADVVELERIAPQPAGETLETLPAGVAPPELAFLAAHGTPVSALVDAARRAADQGVFPETALLAGGAISEEGFYSVLAAHLGVAFVEGDAPLGAAARYPHSIHAGVAPLAHGGWLVAPRGATLSSLLRRKSRGEALRGRIAVTTPANMSRIVRARAAPAIARHASLSLASRFPDLSAKGGATDAQCCAAIALLAFLALAVALTPSLLGVGAIAGGLIFLAAASLRLFAGAASRDCARLGLPPRVEDRLLPPYSIIIALHKEARIVRDLVAALDAIDYPALGSKLTKDG